MKPRSQSYFLPWKHINKFNSMVFVFLAIIFVEVTKSSYVVNTLPGLLGDLPFTLETGYIGVGESEDVQLFYYFIESEGNPKDDPLMIWFTGGPGCSDLFAIMFGIGPLAFNIANSTLDKPMLEINPYSWTKVANIIFVDQPAGTGFSYAKIPDAYITNDTFATMHAYQFLRKWLVDHPKFLNNPFYVGGDSYSGIIVPMVVQEIYNGNEVGARPHINIKGYVLGNPGTNAHDEFNSRIRYAHRMALLSDEIYMSTKENCHGEYLNVDPNNNLCINDLQVVDKCLEKIYLMHILEPSCDVLNTVKYDLSRRGIRSTDQVSKQGCREDNSLYMDQWVNNIEVLEALHIHKELHNIHWVHCNESLQFDIDKKPISYTHNIWSTVSYHRHLAHKKCRALVYSGDHDMFVPYLSTLNWIESLNLLLVDDWRPWFVDKQVAGYTMKYSKHRYNMTFATVKGAGHTAPMFKPRECLSMFTKWLANDPL